MTSYDRLAELLTNADFDPEKVEHIINEDSTVLPAVQVSQLLAFLSKVKTNEELLKVVRERNVDSKMTVFFLVAYILSGIAFSSTAQAYVSDPTWLVVSGILTVFTAKWTLASNFTKLRIHRLIAECDKSMANVSYAEFDEAIRRQTEKMQQEA